MLVAVLGAGMIVAALTVPPVRPRRPAAVVPAVGTRSSAPSLRPAGTTGSPAAVPALGRSVPVRVTISKIGVSADVVPLGLAKDGTLEVPTLEQAYLAGWYRLGPTPGEVGNAVIVGHVDSYKTGPAVFFQLGELRPGDTIAVTRRDGTVVRFTVDSVREYPKTAFPTDLVYGPADRAALRLVTCGGTFDEKARSYLDNTVVFATMTPP